MGRRCPVSCGAWIEPAFDDPGPPIPTPVSRVRRALTVVILLTLVASIVVLAFVSGRGVITAPPPAPSPATPGTLDRATRPATRDRRCRWRSVDDGRARRLAGPLSGRHGTKFSFPDLVAGRRRGSRPLRTGPTGRVIDVFSVPTSGAKPGDPTIVYSSGDQPPFYVYWSPDGTRPVIPDDRDRRSRAPRSHRPMRARRRLSSAPGAPMYWSWAEPRGSSSTAAMAWRGFFGEVRPDGVATEPSAILAGSFRVPAVSSDGRFRAFATPGEATPQRSSSRPAIGPRRTRSTCSARPPSHSARTRDELAFVAAAEPGARARPAGRAAPADGRDIGRRARRCSRAGSSRSSGRRTGRRSQPCPLRQPGDDNVAGRGSRDARLERAPSAAAATGVKVRLAFVTVATGAIRSHADVRAVRRASSTRCSPTSTSTRSATGSGRPTARRSRCPVVADGTDGRSSSSRRMVRRDDSRGRRRRPPPGARSRLATCCTILVHNFYARYECGHDTTRVRLPSPRSASPPGARPPSPLAPPDGPARGRSGDRHRPRRAPRHEHRRDQLSPAQARLGRAGRGDRGRSRQGTAVAGRDRDARWTSATSPTTRTAGPPATGCDATTCAHFVERYGSVAGRSGRLAARLAGRRRRERLRPPPLARRDSPRSTARCRALFQRYPATRRDRRRGRQRGGPGLPVRVPAAGEPR